jgi:hypothetical protein
MGLQRVSLGGTAFDGRLGCIEMQASRVPDCQSRPDGFHNHPYPAKSSNPTLTSVTTTVPELMAHGGGDTDVQFWRRCLSAAPPSLPAGFGSTNPPPREPSLASGPPVSLVSTLSPAKFLLRIQPFVPYFPWTQHHDSSRCCAHIPWARGSTVFRRSALFPRARFRSFWPD